MPRSTRTFVAVDVSADICSRAGQMIDLLSEAGAKVKWVEPTRLHLTLKFLGDVATLELAEICAAAAAAVVAAAPFDFRVRGCGAFPSIDKPRTIWLGVDQGADELVQLHDLLEAGLAPLGFRREQRRFRPHLTLGRVRNSPTGLPELGRLLVEHEDFIVGVAGIDEIVVYSSELDYQGPTYEPLATGPLKGKG